MSAVPKVKLNNGVEIPQLGFGTFQIPPTETRAATLEALRAGYRHIDTAEMYRNEREVAQAVRDSGVPRDEIFVTSKLNNGYHAPKDAHVAFERSLAVMEFDYLDLFLIHWPMPGVGDFVETWKALEEMYESGRVRAIGVSNFQTHHLDRLAAETSVTPAVNQIEIHPYFTQDGLRAYDSAHGIATEAWSPIAQGDVLGDPIITGIAGRVGRTPAQVTLRWHVQVRHAFSNGRELHPLRFRAVGRRHGGHLGPEPPGRPARPQPRRVQLDPGRVGERRKPDGGEPDQNWLMKLHTSGGTQLVL
jgi:2,5-diketo-D-gluconate reductase A